VGGGADRRQPAACKRRVDSCVGESSSRWRICTAAASRWRARDVGAPDVPLTLPPMNARLSTISRDTHACSRQRSLAAPGWVCAAAAQAEFAWRIRSLRDRGSYRTSRRSRTREHVASHAHMLDEGRLMRSVRTSSRLRADATRGGVHLIGMHGDRASVKLPSRIRHACCTREATWKVLLVRRRNLRHGSSWSRKIQSHATSTRTCCVWRAFP
jgi:hypothetical protein